MNKISRKGFLKIAAAAAMSGVTAGALAACNSASSSSTAASAASGTYIPGTYEGTAEGISSTVKVTMTFSDSAVTNVVVDTSGETASYGAAAADQLKEQLLAAGSAEIDGVSGSTVTSDAVMKAAKSCFAQAKGEATVSSVQLPTGDETDWLGKEPDIDEAAITETVDTDILIVGAGNGGMFAAAYAAANGLNFRIIEQNAAVMDTRHWYGAIDSSEAQKQGVPPVDRAELLSEISRSMGGRCDQRVVKTWINESAAMHDFVSGILENEPYNYVCNLTSGDEAKWPDDTQVSQTKFMFPVQQVDYRAGEKPRNVVFQEYIESKGYGVDFNKNVSEVFDREGAVAAIYDYSPYGTATRTGRLVQPVQWSAEMHDDDLALVYYNYRYYNPRDGRWINRDPIAEQGGWNSYSFVGNNPIDSFDINGQNAMARAVPFAAGAAAVDGLLPIGDVIGAIVIVSAGAYDLSQPGPGTGNCTRLFHGMLQSAVNAAKIETALLGKCKDTDCCWLLKIKAATWLKNAIARDTINSKCYQGGDSGHRKASEQAWTNVINCQRKIKIKCNG